ncbi:MAG TPA: hypothetical protein VJ969_01895, partial [Desulfopila sp.]|nr:hypothetical protein [Desulfopila sp.]
MNFYYFYYFSYTLDASTRNSTGRKKNENGLEFPPAVEYRLQVLVNTRRCHYMTTENKGGGSIEGEQWWISGSAACYREL